MHSALDVRALGLRAVDQRRNLIAEHLRAPDLDEEGGSPPRSANSGDASGSRGSWPARYVSAQRSKSRGSAQSKGALSTRLPPLAVEIDPRAGEHRARGQRDPLCSRAQKRDERQVAAGGFPAHDDARRCDARREQTAVRGDGVIDGGGERVLRRQAVVRRERARSAGDGLPSIQVALEALAAHPGVDRSRLAAIGYCFGGMSVLELARSGSALAGVVSFHGLLSTQQPAEPGVIKAKVLACHGVEDPFAPPSQVAAFVEEMRQSECDWQLVTYANAGHGFTRKDAASLGMKGVYYEERADRRSWAAMRTFFDEIFAQPQEA